MTKKFITITAIFCISIFKTFAQTDTSKSDVNIDDLLGSDKTEKVYAMNAFKSSRVIMGQSMEMLGAGVLDTRILHRFGLVNNGIIDAFGLDIAKMRLGLDYGVTKDLSVGIGRSVKEREIDGFVKYRILHQHTGNSNMPISLIYVAGSTTRYLYGEDSTNKFTNRLSYYHQLIIGRKFSNSFSLQLSPTFLHQNFLYNTSMKNDIIAMGIGTRYKISNRTALLLDAFPILSGGSSGTTIMPLSIGFDIETGGHVFQIHLSNAEGMNERAFIAETTNKWGSGQFSLGFNLSRVFTVKANKTSW